MLTHFRFFSSILRRVNYHSKDVKRHAKTSKEYLEKVTHYFVSFCFCFVQFDGKKTILSDDFQTVHKLLLYLIFLSLGVFVNFKHLFAIFACLCLSLRVFAQL